MDTHTPAALAPFFWLAARAPRLVGALRPMAVEAVVRASQSVRDAAAANARGIFGRELSPSERLDFARGVVGSFYDFAVDVGSCSRLDRAQLIARIDGAEGEDEYARARQAGLGAILVTAHLGSFEVGLAALTRAEPVVRVVFRRDAVSPFEHARRRIRETLGVIEAPIDEGLSTWLELRDALQRNEVVVMQGDRTMPGQRGQVVPFLHGRLRLPLGPMRLAQLTGSPLIPVFSVRGSSGKVRVILGRPVDAGAAPPHDGGLAPALTALSEAIGAVVARYPQQWLALGRVFEQDPGSTHAARAASPEEHRP